jgi:hypothetical protein
MTRYQEKFDNNGGQPRIDNIIARYQEQFDNNGG